MRVFAAIRLFMPHHTFAFVALALVLAILGVLGYKLSPLLFARADALLPPTSCNPAETPCSAALPDGGRVVADAVKLRADFHAFDDAFDAQMIAHDQRGLDDGPILDELRIKRKIWEVANLG